MSLSSIAFKISKPKARLAHPIALHPLEYNVKLAMDCIRCRRY